MLARIVGCFWVALGLFFLFRPQALKNRFCRKSNRRLRRYLFLIALFLGGLLITSAYKYQGWIPRAAMVIGVAAIFKGIFFLRSRASEKLIEWMGERPLSFYRFAAVVQLVFGLVIFFGLRP